LFSNFAEAKECLELEMNELRASHDHLSVENHMLQARLQNFHALEGILFKFK
jgi:hypothetical protein